MGRPLPGRHGQRNADERDFHYALSRILSLRLLDVTRGSLLDDIGLTYNLVRGPVEPDHEFRERVQRYAWTYARSGCATLEDR